MNTKTKKTAGIALLVAAAIGGFIYYKKQNVSEGQTGNTPEVNYNGPLNPDANVNVIDNPDVSNYNTGSVSVSGLSGLMN